MKEKYTTILYDVKKALGVTLQEYIILDTIFHLENHSKDRGCYAKIGFYMEITDMGERTTQRTMMNLVKLGYIEVTKTASNTASRRTTEKYKAFRLDDAQQVGANLAPTTGRRNVTRRVPKRHPVGAKLTVTPIDNNNDNNNDTKSAEAQDEKPICSVENCKGKVVIVPLAIGEVELNKCERHRLQDIIDGFKSVNESYLELYGKKTQYDAAKQLMRTYPREHIHWMLKTAPGYNKMPYRAAGEKVYTPYDLLKNWSVMKDNLMSIKIKKATGTQPKEILG